MIIEGLKVRLNPVSALDHKEGFSINLKPRILYLPKIEGSKVLPDGSIIPPAVPVEPAIIVEADGTEIILLEGIQEEPNLAPVDTDTGLP